MKYVGVDLHKRVISASVMAEVNGQRVLLERRKFFTRDPLKIRQFFLGLGEFRVTVEATASYEWFLELIEDLAERIVLSHPKKLRVIAESTQKTDKIDADILALFLTLDMLPEAWRPTPRVRQWRVLVRHRGWLQGRITAVKCKLRNKLAHYNQDIPNLFTEAGGVHLASVNMQAADRFQVQHLQAQLQLHQQQLHEVDAELKQFAKQASQPEREAREVLGTIPQVGAVTIDVVLSELGEFRRFRSEKHVTAYAGLAPGLRESAGKRHDLHITKEGSRLLRWALIEAAWRLVGRSRRWEVVYERLRRSTGSKKKAIVAVGRKLLCMMFSMLKSGQAYRWAATGSQNKPARPPGEPLVESHSPRPRRLRRKGGAEANTTQPG